MTFVAPILLILFHVMIRVAAAKKHAGNVEENNYL